MVDNVSTEQAGDRHQWCRLWRDVDRKRRMAIPSSSRLIRGFGMLLVAFLVQGICGSASGQTPGVAPVPGWIADPGTGCKVWNPAPEPNESVTWSGPCVKGFADGLGVEQWYKNGKAGIRVEAVFSHGSSTGVVTISYPNGMQYIGKLNGPKVGPSGIGALVFPNGDRYNGAFTRGLPIGTGSWVLNSNLIELEDQIELRFMLESYQSQLLFDQAVTVALHLLKVVENAKGSDHPSVATSLNNLAEIYIDQGRYGEAEPLRKRALAILEKARGSDHLDVVSSLNGLARIYVSQGRYGEAEPLRKRALAIREKALGPDHPDVATALNNLAQIYRNQGRYSEAEPLHKRALAIWEKALGSDHPDVATSLNNLATIYIHQGRYGESEPLQKRALAIREKELGPEHSDVAISLNNLAQNHSNQGRYGEAELLQKRALAIWEKALGPDHPDVALSLNNLAEIYRNQGRDAEAEPLYKRALAIFEKAYGSDHLNVAYSLNNLALIYRNQGRDAEAEPLHKRALVILEKELGPDHPNVARSLNNLAAIYVYQGRYDEAEKFVERALEIQKKALEVDDRSFALLLNNLAFIYSHQDRYDEAEEQQKFALLIYEKILGHDHPDVATSLNNLALIYLNQGRYGEAEPLQQRALAIQEKVLGPDHPHVAQSLNNLAFLDIDQGRFADALPLLRRLLSIGSVNRLLLPIAYAMRQNNLIEHREALSMSLSIMQGSSVTGARDAVSKFAQRFSAGSGDQATLIREDQDLGNQSVALDKLLTEQFAKAPELRNKDTEANIRKRISDIATNRKEIAGTLATRFPDYIALTKPPELSVTDIQELLAEDEALITFDFAVKGYTWVVTRDTADWTEMPTTAVALADEVKTLRASLAFGQTNAAKSFDVDLAYKIYQQTLGPLEEKFAGKKRLSIYVNGALSSIPLQLLVTKDPTGKAYKDVDWLVKSAAITNLPSIYSLKASRRQLPPSAATKPMVAFADPVFARDARAQAGTTQQVALRGMPSFYNGTQLDAAALARSLPQLPGTRREVEAVGRSLGASQADLHLGLAATVRAVQEAKLYQYRVVYFATHALVAGDMAKFASAKAEPALALTFPEKPTEDDNGLLPASEVAQLKLDADWVVLSACNTAAGDQPGAEALSGLARAFIYAGARSLLVSHWEVNDTATSNLMRRVFEISRTKPTLSHGEALREAELRTLEAARNEDEAHPRNWAPFVVVGEPPRAAGGSRVQK